MKIFFAVLLLSVLAHSSVPAQHSGTSDADRIDLELSTFDLRPFEWQGEPDPVPPRLGFYFRRVPPDSVARITGKGENDPWYEIWHVMPGWSADMAGILAGDTLTAIDGKPIGDEKVGGQDFIDLLAREKKGGDVLRFSVRRGGTKKNVKVPLLTFDRTPMSYTTPEALGPIRPNSWLSERLQENGLVDWTREIARQMKVIADVDFCRVPFAGRPNPWRLNAVTYLHNNPARTGAYSRMIVDDLWSGADTVQGLSGAVRAAAVHLDLLPDGQPRTSLPGSFDQFKEYLLGLGARTREAYGDALPGLNRTTRELAALLDPGADWTAGLDSIPDPSERRTQRLLLEKRIAGLFATADGVDLAELASVAADMAALVDSVWLVSLAREFEGQEPLERAGVPGVEGEVLLVQQTRLGTFIVGGPGPNRYTAAFPFILDLGGDDVYAMPAPEPGFLRLIADLGGDDLYTGDVYAQGAGVGCVDVLIDLAGDDVYRASGMSQGAGLLGAGILADFSGDDIYASRWCSQGAAFLGIGLLYDGDGADTYNAELYAQGFGYARGCGVLLDRSGNDTYRAGWKYEDSRYPDRAHIAMSQGFGFGMRPWTTGVGTDGGIGVLSDRSGDDLYASDFFSQGGSYWYALGILHDGEGADRYTAGQYSQGSGIHLSFGALLDDAGDDMYDAYHGLEQGNAHDWSAGCLEDLSGNDTYRGSTSSQGSALNVAFAWLLDRSGDDLYYVLPSDTTSNQGGGNFNRSRKHGSLGMLLDFGSGNDFYTEPRVVPGSILLKGKGNGFLFDDGEKE